MAKHSRPLLLLLLCVRCVVDQRLSSAAADDVSSDAVAAVCTPNANGYTCECPEGFAVSGLSCIRTPGGAANACLGELGESVCDSPTMSCFERLRGYDCVCPSNQTMGLTGCVGPGDAPLLEARCVPNENKSGYACDCPSGYVTVGETCVRPMFAPSVDRCKTPSGAGACRLPVMHCETGGAGTGYACECPAGQTYEGGACVPSSAAACSNACGQNAHCVGETCTCDPHYSGDGQRCVPMTTTARRLVVNEHVNAFVDASQQLWSWGYEPWGYSSTPTVTATEVLALGLGTPSPNYGATHRVDAAHFDSQSADNNADSPFCQLTWENGRRRLACGTNGWVDQSGDDWSAMSVSANNVCVVSALDRGVYCLGSNATGILGDAALPDSSSLVRVGSTADWVTVSLGDRFACGVRDQLGARTLWCWGSNLNGQLAQPLVLDSTDTPTQVGTRTDWLDVSAGAESVCGIANGSVQCWGLDETGALGQGPLAALSLTEPTAVSLPAAAAEVAHRRTHTCARLVDDRVYCFGADLSLPTLAREEPLQVDAEHYTDVQVAPNATYALRTDGTLWVFGGYGEAMGLGEGIDRHDLPIRIGDQTYSALGRVDTRTACAIDPADEAQCWGVMTEDIPPFGVLLRSATPMPLAGSWRSISSSVSHLCAVATDGALFCAGGNSIGQLGSNGGSTSTLRRVGAGNGWLAVAVGRRHSCAIAEDVPGERRLYCFGENKSGQLGTGDRVARSAPTEVAGGYTDWSEVSVGPHQTCAIRDGAAGRTLWCFGYKVPTPIGSFESVSEPVKVSNDSDWLSIDVHWRGAAGLRGNAGAATAYQWLGTGAVEPLTAINDWRKLSGSEHHVCGIRADETLWCLGSFRSGQLGRGDSVQWTPIELHFD